MIKISSIFAGHVTLKSLPAYIPGKPIEELEREFGMTGVVKLASNENPLGPSLLAMAALTTASRGIARYPDSNAFLLKEALARKWNVKSNRVIIGNGSDEIIALLARALLAPGDEAMMADPSFSIYRLTTLAGNATPIVIPLKDGRHDLSRMAAAVTQRTKIIFICNPNNPTGTIVRRRKVEEFLSRLPKNILVVFDEAYAEYVTDPEFPRSDLFLKKGACVIFLRTFSKIYGLAGVRVGYGIGPEELIDLLNRVRQPFNVNSLAQQAATAALSDDAHVKKSLALNEKGKRYLYRQFDAMRISYLPTEANFVYFEMPKKNVYDSLLRKGVIIRRLEGASLRVSIGKTSEMWRFIHALRETIKL
ncbi:MAG: histidinol-phosphate transaminase [Nitrospirae bacterium]|nr:histidinol-phosphate transaminase [Candidatus Troglogloeales bacterium]MBI3598076.1 histidinol-phosphate transaminase [Candidatus Troglogloeales bacterium]